MLRPLVAGEAPAHLHDLARAAKINWNSFFSKPPDNARVAAVKSVPIAIVRATYGLDSGTSGGAGCFVAPRANGRTSVSVKVSNQICGDPSPGKRKSLNINFLCGNFETVAADAHQMVYVPYD